MDGYEAMNREAHGSSLLSDHSSRRIAQLAVHPSEVSKWVCPGIPEGTGLGDKGTHQLGSYRTGFTLSPLDGPHGPMRNIVKDNYWGVTYKIL